jgi:hypothetical protein
MLVSVAAIVNGGSILGFFADGASPPVFQVGALGLTGPSIVPGGVNPTGTVTFLVMPNEFYLAQFIGPGNGSISSWIEWW